MTSKYTEIQDIYNKIKCFYSTIKDDEKEIDLDLPLHYDLTHYMQTLLGVEKTWFSNSINYNKHTFIINLNQTLLLIFWVIKYPNSNYNKFNSFRHPFSKQIKILKFGWICKFN